MDVDEYLKRIHCSNLKEISLENLKLLQSNHLKEIAFENYDIHLNKHISLSIEAAYNKTIKSSRGGYCFELNPLFAWLLKQLGYKLDLIACYYYDPKLNEYSNYKFHTAIIVHLDHVDYFVDVGIPKPMLRYPLRLEYHLIQDQLFEIFRFSNNEISMYVLERLKFNNEWIPLIKFELNYYDLDEFNYLNELAQTDAFPSLYNHTICSKHINNGLLLLVDYKFSHIIYENRMEFRNEKNLSVEECLFVLKTLFGILLFDNNTEEFDKKLKFYSDTLIKKKLFK